MTKKKLFILFLMLLPLSVAAQVKFGYLSYLTICQEMPKYAQAQQDLLDLKAVYEQEAKRGEEEFQRKFSEFLSGQKDFPVNIMRKRQAELQELMDKGIQFRKEAEQLLADAEKSLLKELNTTLNEAIVAVGVEMGYAFILNIDDNACPFINPLLGDDVSDFIRLKLGIPVMKKQFDEGNAPASPNEEEHPTNNSSVPAEQIVTERPE